MGFYAVTVDMLDKVLKLSDEDLKKYHVNPKEYPKYYSAEEVHSAVFKVLRMSCFMADEVYQGLEVCTIHCSDVDYNFLKN